MKKVYFEIEVEDEVFNTLNPDTSDDLFIHAEGKVFLCVDPVTGCKDIVVCEKGKAEDCKYANLSHYLLPVNAKIIGDPQEDPILAELRRLHERVQRNADNAHDDINLWTENMKLCNKQVIDYTQQCTDKASDVTKLYSEKILSAITDLMNAVKEHSQNNPGSNAGVSEQALTRIVEIITHK